MEARKIGSSQEALEAGKDRALAAVNETWANLEYRARGAAARAFHQASLVVFGALMILTLSSYFLLIIPACRPASWLTGPGGLVLALAAGLLAGAIGLALLRSAYSELAARSMMPGRRGRRRDPVRFRLV